MDSYTAAKADSVRNAAEGMEGGGGSTQTFYIVSGAIFYGQTTQSAIYWDIWKMEFSFSDDCRHSLSM